MWLKKSYIGISFDESSIMSEIYYITSTSIKIECGIERDLTEAKVILSGKNRETKQMIVGLIKIYI